MASKNLFALPVERLGRIIGPMRTTYQSATVRLYHLSDAQEGGAATTLFYGPLNEALLIAEQQPADVQHGLFLATDNDVVAYLDLIDG
jgi:hypothetical protein